jgi:hypothetical protein
MLEGPVIGTQEREQGGSGFILIVKSLKMVQYVPLDKVRHFNKVQFFWLS